MPTSAAGVKGSLRPGVPLNFHQHDPRYTLSISDCHDLPGKMVEGAECCCCTFRLRLRQEKNFKDSKIAKDGVADRTIAAPAREEELLPPFRGQTG